MLNPLRSRGQSWLSRMFGRWWRTLLAFETTYHRMRWSKVGSQIRYSSGAFCSQFTQVGRMSFICQYSSCIQECRSHPRWSDKSQSPTTGSRSYDSTSSFLNVSDPKTSDLNFNSIPLGKKTQNRSVLVRQQVKPFKKRDSKILNKTMNLHQ